MDLYSVLGFGILGSILFSPIGLLCIAFIIYKSWDAIKVLLMFFAFAYLIYACFDSIIWAIILFIPMLVIIPIGGYTVYWFIKRATSNEPYNHETDNYRLGLANFIMFLTNSLDEFDNKKEDKK